MNLARALAFAALILLACGTMDGATVLVLNLDRNSANDGPNSNSSTDDIKPLLTSLGYAYDFLEVDLHDHTTLATMNFSSYQLLIICVGTNCVFQAAHRFDSSEGNHLVAYLNAGGKIYLEGNDVWYQDPHAHGAFDFKTYFNVNPTNDGGIAEMNQVRGVAGANPNTQGLVFGYTQDNCFPDWITRLNPTGGSNIFLNRTALPNQVDNMMAVSYNSGTYKTIACSFEFGGLVDGTGNSTKAHVWQLYMDWFGVTAGTAYGDVDNDGNVDADDLALLADYLADNVTVLPGGVSRADVNNSGVVDGTDLTILHHYLVGNITSLPFTG